MSNNTWKNIIWAWIDHNRTGLLIAFIGMIGTVIQAGFVLVDHFNKPLSSNVTNYNRPKESEQVEATQRTNPHKNDPLTLPKAKTSTTPPIKQSPATINLLSKPEPDEVTRLLERLGDASGQDRGKRLLDYLQEMPIVHPLTPEQILQILGNISGDSIDRREALRLIMQNHKNEPLSGQDAVLLLEGFVDTNRAYALQDMRCYIKKPLSEAEKQSLLAGVGLSRRSDVERMLDNPTNASCK